MRGAVYYDGFNLYYSIKDLKKEYLKWVDLWKLGELITKGHAKSLEQAHYCTVVFPGDTGRKARHEAYITALEYRGVTVQRGHTKKEPMECRDCLSVWDESREKASDINLAMAVYNGAIDDAYDAAFVVTADTDQVATFQIIRQRFPDKKIFTVTPPGRRPSEHLKSLAHGAIKLTEEHIDLCSLPHLVEMDGQRSIIRPHEYNPPAGWVHPDQRPK